MSEPLLRISNHHTPSCGDPPIVDANDPAVYVGYFANRYGEQWIFTYDRRTKTAELRGGDVGWNTRYEFQNGEVTGLVFAPEESTWLKACWHAATG
ncbi:MAG TPA: hypothetical protein VGH74_19255 [Planctomycetaceae bacterium]|jgi:hypothetical protein